jgi:hypothetical protein
MNADNNNMQPSPLSDIVFEITQEDDGGFCAECLTESIFTQAETWDELRANVHDAVKAFYFDRPQPFTVSFR